MKIGFVVTNYNNSIHSENFVKSIMKLIKNKAEQAIEIVIVDNASNELEKQKLLELSYLFPSIKIILNKTNVGYFKGLNVGIEFLNTKDNKCDILVVGNNDLLFPDNFFESVENNTELYQMYPIISPDIENLNGDHENPHVIRKISYPRKLIYKIYYTNYFFAKLILEISNTLSPFFKRKDQKYNNESAEIYQGYGACYILTPNFFKYYKYLFAPIFLNHEELLIAHQLSILNMKIFYEPSIKVFHNEHSTTAKLPRRIYWNFSRESFKYLDNFEKLSKEEKENEIFKISSRTYENI